MLAAVGAMPRPAMAQSPTVLTQAGGAVFAGGPVYRGVRLTRGKFGMGGAIAGDGSAFGVLSFQLAGVTVSGGLARTLDYQGTVQAGSVSPAGVVSVSGSGTLDPGDGSPVVTSVPFVLEVTPNVEGQGTLVFTLEAVHLGAALVDAGGVSSTACAPPELASSLRFTDALTLGWAAVPAAVTYDVYRGTMQSGGWSFDHACIAPGVAGTSVVDATNPLAGKGLYYLVSVKNACGEGSLGVATSGAQVPNPLPCP
jgi:hypothetical protein